MRGDTNDEVLFFAAQSQFHMPARTLEYIVFDGSYNAEDIAEHRDFINYIFGVIWRLERGERLHVLPGPRLLGDGGLILWGAYISGGDCGVGDVFRRCH